MKSFANPGLSKLEPSSKLSLIINRKASNEKSRLIEIGLKETQKLPNEVLVYADIKVALSGFYHISNQLSIKCNKPTQADVLQFGICDKDFVDFGNCFNSVMLRSTVDDGDNITNNLSSITYLDAETQYIGWLNFQSADNSSFEFCNSYSNIKLIKL